MLTVKNELLLEADILTAEEFITSNLMSATEGEDQAGCQASSDAQLFSTLCEIDKINYLYMFERCKAYHINARQLRYLEKEHIRRIIPSDQVGIQAEFEFMHSKWKHECLQKSKPPHMISAASVSLTSTSLNVDAATTPLSGAAQSPHPIKVTVCSPAPPSNGLLIPLPITTDPKITLSDPLAVEKPSAANKNALKRKFDYRSHTKNPNLESAMTVANGEHEYLLDDIIVHDMRKIREEYAKNGILTERERRRISASLVEFFKNSDIYMSRDIMESLAVQISTVFPTESKRAWHDTEGRQRRGRLCLKLYNMQRSKKRHKSKYADEEGDVADSIMGEQCIDFDETTQDDAQAEDDHEGERLQLWLRDNKLEDNDELMQMWYETANYRTRQLKKYNTPGGEHLEEVLSQWPSYKLPIGNILLSIDFNTLYPNSESVFYERWPIFMQKIHKLYKLEVRLDLYDQYHRLAHMLNTETKQSIMIHLLHTLLRPTRPIHPRQLARRYTIIQSQNAFSRFITDVSEMADYDEPQPILFILGGMLNVKKVFVAFKNVRYELKFMDALFTCHQLYLTLKLDFPLACLNFWTFVQCYFFELTPQPGTNKSVVDHIINFLVTP